MHLYIWFLPKKKDKDRNRKISTKLIIKKNNCATVSSVHILAHTKEHAMKPFFKHSI